MTTKTGTTLEMDEPHARRLILAQAIEMSDAQANLLTDTEGDQLGLRAIELARAAAGPAGEIDVAAALSRRADLVLEAVEKRNATLAALREIPFWRPWVIWGVPLVCLVLGVAGDRI